MSVLGVVTAAWAGVMALSPLLQIRTMLRERSSRSVSVGYFGVLCAGFCLWVAYGLTRHDPVLVLPNGAALVVGVTTIAIALSLRRESAPR